MSASAPFPIYYSTFFLFIEPLATLVGAVYAAFYPSAYLTYTHAASAPKLLAIPLATSIALSQLGNLYFCFALSEALVLRSTSDPKVWRAFLICLLIADFGHLATCYPLGPEVYYAVSRWNPIDWGNIAFVYAGAATRICFLTGVGMGGLSGVGAGVKKVKTRARKSIANTAAAAEEVKDDVIASVSTPKGESAAAAKTPAKSTRRRKSTKSISGGS